MQKLCTSLRYRIFFWNTELMSMIVFQVFLAAESEPEIGEHARTLERSNRLHRTCSIILWKYSRYKISWKNKTSIQWTPGSRIYLSSMKIIFEKCIIYPFFDFFCSKIFFDQKLFSYCWKKFDYLGSIVYLSFCRLES